MRYFTYAEIIELHVMILLRDGGMDGVRDAGHLEEEIAEWLRCCSSALK